METPQSSNDKCDFYQDHRPMHVKLHPESRSIHIEVEQQTPARLCRIGTPNLIQEQRTEISMQGIVDKYMELN